MTSTVVTSLASAREIRDNPIEHLTVHRMSYEFLVYLKSRSINAFSFAYGAIVPKLCSCARRNLYH